MKRNLTLKTQIDTLFARKEINMKIRLYRDIEAEDIDKAMEKMDDLLMDEEGMQDATDLFNAQENPLSDEEETVLLEVARIALADGEIFDKIVEQLDMTDSEMKKLQDKIQDLTSD